MVWVFFLPERNGDEKRNSLNFCKFRRAAKKSAILPPLAIRKFGKKCVTLSAEFLMKNLLTI